MKYANEIFFLVFALILWGLLYGSRFILMSGKTNQSKKLWLTALTLTATSFTLFALASTISLFLLTLANTCFIASFIYFGLFCRSLSILIPKNVNMLVLAGLLFFAVLFEYLRQRGLFIQRVGLVSIIGALCFVWELKELMRLKGIGSTQLRFLVYTIAIEIALTVARFVALYIDGGFSTPNLYQEGVVSASIRWAWLGISILSYVAVLGYWLEKLSIENIQVAGEHEKITELLKEKERLIYGLMKANKTAATGALSASIAHELNQPLGASNLNIQFLKMKLEKGVLNPELGKEILDSLEQDNKRAATIVKSLRSIFTEGESNTQKVLLGDLIEKVLDIVKPELKSKNIQIQLQVDNGLLIQVNSAEIEQVILNLLNNAIQALANSGTLQRRIVIDAIRDGKSVQLSVSDNGPGVIADFKSQLFELLSTTKQTGMGLGLWLCKHIVTRYGGFIQYEDAVAGGARFVIKLPQAYQ
ncbi:GHKL domain-containing protein [Polynucleobacter sp. JS-Mosq-20-D10]|uniref:sensor histidine kinase n=1 Tax=Polynucleobacter sp. JS-Mosq-20-D10 TaxID=2576922 RepID=UPI001BFDA067|nr:ATP-binding protein [Polynucleobacter sp. JS-Mosq-20-D10]QWE00420.1 GHKL domain-containing protein [Polynucleobacter sp. JS-Mosq-20-D10]